jgi:ABC-type uncharacterized transport system permease subunit
MPENIIVRNRRYKSLKSFPYQLASICLLLRIVFTYFVRCQLVAYAPRSLLNDSNEIPAELTKALLPTIYIFTPANTFFKKTKVTDRGSL